MKKQQLFVVLALVFGSAAANAVEMLDLDDVAARTGLSVKEVRMVLGAPTAFAEYRTKFRIAEQRVKGVLGEKQYRELAEAYKRSDAKVLAAR